MKPQENTTSANSEIKHRLVVPIQTRGNIGKSTEAIARCEWMNHHNVLWKGYDLDGFNQTLSTTHPGQVIFIPPTPEPEGEIVKILRRIPEAEVTVIDPSAHMNQTILKAFQMVRFAELAAGVQPWCHLTGVRFERRVINVVVGRGTTGMILATMLKRLSAIDAVGIWPRLPG